MAQDFDRSPIWSFDIRRAKSDRLADETYVRPIAPRDRTEVKDAIFLQATFRTAGNEDPLAGAIIMRFSIDHATLKRDPLPTVDGLLFLRPYDAFTILDERTLERSRDLVEKFEPDLYAEGDFVHEAILRTAQGALPQRGKMKKTDRTRLVAELTLRQRSLPLTYDATLRIGVEYYRFEGTMK